MGIFDIFQIPQLLMRLILGTFLPVFMLEVIDMVIMSIAVAYIFEGFFGTPYTTQDPIERYKKKRFFNRETFIFSLYAIAPSVVLHELFHKLASLSLGIPATFYASYGGLLLGIILKLLNTGFIFFIPGFVSIGESLPWQSALISFAGPFANLLLWFISRQLLKKPEKLSVKQVSVLRISQKINLFLFFFNMIPIPPFDGGHFFGSLFKMIF